MGLKSLMGGVIAATFVFGAAACTGTANTGGAPEVVGDRAEIVAQKRDWLRQYDENCDVCFKAFELCGKGARDEAETDACQVALDACVRGGLVKPEEPGDEDNDDDAGVVDDGDDNNDDGEDADAGVVDGDDNNDDEDADAGVDGDDNNDDEDADAGVDGDDNEDGDDNNDDDADSDEAADEAADGRNDGDADGRPGDQVKGELIDDVRACLDTGESCLEADGADVKECLTALRACVQEALDDAFESVCSTQHRQCREENASDDEVSSVEDLCNGGVEPEDLVD